MFDQALGVSMSVHGGYKKRLSTNIKIHMNTKLNTVTAPRSTQIATGNSFAELSLEQMDALLEARKNKVAETQAPLEETLNADYAKCVVLANEIKAFNPEYKAPWETATPLMLGHAIKDWLATKGGSATTKEIVSQFNHLTSDKQIEEVLTGRTKGGKYRLWDYNESKDTYTLKSETKANTNN
jgi:hypothetical protein